MYADAGYIRADELRPDVVGGELWKPYCSKQKFSMSARPMLPDADEYDGKSRFMPRMEAISPRRPVTL